MSSVSVASHSHGSNGTTSGEQKILEELRQVRQELQELKAAVAAKSRVTLSDQDKRDIASGVHVSGGCCVLM